MRTNAKTAFLRLGIILTLEMGAIPLLVRLGSLRFLATPGLHPGQWGTWAARTPPADAVAAVARLAGLGLATWLLGGTTLYLLGGLGRLPSLIRGRRWLAPPAVRRVVDTALAVALTTTVAAGSAAWAAGPPAPPVPQAAPAPVAAVASAPKPPDTHVVVRGESLWSIAAATVHAARLSANSEAVARYWVDVVTLNRPGLRSGNPNLIFPGEAVSLPPQP